MSWTDYQRWIDRGSPFRLITPASDLRDVLRRHGYVVYDRGNESHMVHEPPEDHTPYSETSYPGRSVYGVGYAVDIMPPAAGARSPVDGRPLPSLQQLGARLLADRKAGEAGIRWLKYMNWEPERNNGGACWHESWQPAYVRRSSGDRGHIHISGLTGYESSTVGAGYDPVTRIRGGEDDMTPEELLKADVLPWVDGTQYSVGGALYDTATRVKDTAARVARMEVVLTELSGKDFTDEPAIIQGLLASLTPEKIAAAIPPTMAKQVADELAARLAA